MKHKFSINRLTLAFASLLLAVGACNPNQIKDEKVKVLEYQGYVVSKQMGINDVYDTTHSYRTVSITDSTIFILKTKDRLSLNDLVNVGRACR